MRRIEGEFVDFADERYYVIRNVDRMQPFFISVISNVDHWLFISSTGGLTAGRVSPETALFPYVTVDKIHESTAHTGSKTLLHATVNGRKEDWEPFKSERSGRFKLTRNIYKNLLGDKICFEEINHDLDLAFRYTWSTSEEFGFVRSCELQNLGTKTMRVDLIDGLQNILPAGTPAFTQANSSNLVDAYKWTELDEDTGLALFTLYSGITDRAEPCESLRANTAYCLGLSERKLLLSSEQLNDFRVGADVFQETHKRGIRGAYLVNVSLDLAANSIQTWQIVADIEQTQSSVIELQQRLANPEDLAVAIAESIGAGSDDLARTMACGDSLQSTSEETVSAHHYANVLFNVLRGGIFDDQYTITARDLVRTIKHFNTTVFARNEDFLTSLPAAIELKELLENVREHGDLQLLRLCYDYLPITFGRRHGDPSRPWNQFEIKLKDEQGERLLSYQGNWRDIFQNWEALAFSYPAFIENIIAKFVNASTADGYNPYRVTKDGFDWEVEEPDNPWSYIGYWGDHQIIYLQKLLELSRAFHPSNLGSLLYEPIFCYANVPYRIKSFEELLENPKSTVTFDNELAERIEQRISEMGADGKVILNSDGEVYQVNLIEKLLVSLLAKLGNLVVDGGIWMNTQRPEWNDANNALVGQGLSMVTLYYMRRYVRFLLELLAVESRPVPLSGEVSTWLSDTATGLRSLRNSLNGKPVSPEQRYQTLGVLGEAASHYRLRIYQQNGFTETETRPLGDISEMLNDALVAIDHSIGSNVRKDGLYHAYNLLSLQEDSIEISTLYPMLEGQVAALSSGAVSATDAASVLEALFKSDVYRPDQDSFMLYPDRELPRFLEKNRIDDRKIQAIPVLQRMLDEGDTSIVVRDAAGDYRFNADMENVGALNARIKLVEEKTGELEHSVRRQIQTLYESVFNHQAFTGRSGGMFGFEGLGCIYWHMVSKLLLAVQENFFSAIESGEEEATIRRLGNLYYRVRTGIGFNKSPGDFGAFPADPYSHSPKHAGARQPGMTGQVKEEILTRFGELGVRVGNGMLRFQPALLRPREFTSGAPVFRFLDVAGTWKEIPVPDSGLAFTWCQVPVTYSLKDGGTSSLSLLRADGSEQTLTDLALSADDSTEIFNRSGRIQGITLTITRDNLFESQDV